MERKISRRAMLRTTATLTTGVVAAGAVSLDAAADTAPASSASVPDHDPATGEIFDRDRHHRWDTV